MKHRREFNLENILKKSFLDPSPAKVSIFALPVPRNARNSKAEYMSNDLLLCLPHSLVTLSIPRCLRVFFRHDRKLFSEVSRLIFDMVVQHDAARLHILTEKSGQNRVFCHSYPTWLNKERQAECSLSGNAGHLIRENKVGLGQKAREQV